MYARVFTRRRHEITSHRRRLRFAAWLGLPVTAFLATFQLLGNGRTGAFEAAAAALIGLLYVRSVFRLRELTGDWRFH